MTLNLKIKSGFLKIKNYYKEKEQERYKQYYEQNKEKEKEMIKLSNIISEAVAPKFEPIKLKFKFKDYAPSFDEETMKTHFTKHYQSYIDKLNEAVVEENSNNKSQNIQSSSDLKETSIENNDEFRSAQV